jgi:hypothetical protein
MDAPASVTSCRVARCFAIRATTSQCAETLQSICPDRKTEDVCEIPINFEGYFMNETDFLESLDSHDHDSNPDIFRKNYLEILNDRDGHVKVLPLLKNAYFNCASIAPDENQRVWEIVGLYLRYLGRIPQAIQVFEQLYECILEYQIAKNKRIHKGMPLVWISQLHFDLKRPATALKYLMLTLCEDALIDIDTSGHINKAGGGVYFRLAYNCGMDDTLIDNYALKINNISKANPKFAFFPEWLLQSIDNNWNIAVPTSIEAFSYRISPTYVKYLTDRLGSGTGKEMELLSEYLLMNIPGVRTYRRVNTRSTDYDIVCALECSFADFRKEIGTYFICECKDWDKPIDFSSIAKFCRILDSVKCKFGIVFSKNGITGDKEVKYADVERLKVFQDRGLVILIINQKDILQIQNGSNFIVMLRSKYEDIRLDSPTRKHEI